MPDVESSEVDTTPEPIAPESVTPEPVTPKPVTLISTVPPDARLLLYINAELGQGATGIVHGGLLEVESGDERARLDVAVKLSFSERQRDRLEKEWSTYVHLIMEDVEGIPMPLGIFHDPELRERAPLCFLMSHVGKSLRASGMSITLAQRYVLFFTLVSLESDKHTKGTHSWQF